VFIDVGVIMADNIPPLLKPVGRFLQVAKTLDKAQPVIAHYCTSPLLLSIESYLFFSLNFNLVPLATTCTSLFPLRLCKIPLIVAFSLSTLWTQDAFEFVINMDLL
jgi:hypothetical protein